MYVDENHWARSSPLPHECAPDTDQEILMKSYFTRFGPDAPEVDNGDMVTVFDSRGGFNWTALSSGGVARVYCRQPAFAIKPKWTFVPEDSVPEDVRSRIFG